MSKLALRKYYKNKRAELESADREKASQDIAKQLNTHWKFKDELISVFLPIKKLFEINTQFIIDDLSKKNTFCSPVADFSTHQMQHIELSESTVIKENDWGIPEPINGHSFQAREITIVLLPLLISDVKGHRLGYGKGFYDRFLNLCNPGTLFIGVNYFEPIEEIPEVSQYDIPIDFLITPRQIFKSESSKTSR